MGGVRLNLGCGKRYLPGWLNVDRSPAVRADRHAELADGLPWLADGTVDVINARAVIEHVERGRLLFVMDECFRVLRPGGAMYLQLPPADRHFWQDPTHHSAWCLELVANGRWPIETMSHFEVGNKDRPNADYGQLAAFQIAWRHELLFTDAPALHQKHAPELTWAEFKRLHSMLVDALCYWLEKPGGPGGEWVGWDREIVAAKLFPNGYYHQHVGGRG